MSPHAREGDVDYRRVYSNAAKFSFQAIGGQISNVIINYLARKYNVAIEDTLTRPRLLCEALEGALGAGALLIERRIIKSIYAQLEAPLNDANFQVKSCEDFSRYLVDSQLLYQQRLAVRNKEGRASSLSFHEGI